MAWLGFTFAKRPTQAAAAPSPAAASLSTSFDDDDEDEFVSSSAKPRAIRQLRPEEIAQLERENAQLKELLQQLAAKANANPHQQQSLNDNTSAPPASNPSVTPSAPPAPADFTFCKLSTLMSQHTAGGSSTVPSAPPLERRASGAPVDLAPIGDFYESLRASLAASNKSTAAASSSAAVDSDADDWGSDESTNAKPTTATDSVNAPRTEDEAIVHNKHGSIVVHKKPLKPILDDDVATASAAVAPATKPTANEIDCDDFGDFGMETETTAAAAAGEEPEEEIAIFDMSQADWWYVVPHPDRAGEELVSAPPPPLDPNEDEDGFVVIKNKDSVTALGEFIASMMARHPEIARLSPEQLRDMLDASMVDRGLKAPSTSFGKVWQIGKQAYTIWSWGSWGFSLYKDQSTLRMVAAGVIKAAQWSCIFLI